MIRNESQSYKEVDGEILPVYKGVNQPRYFDHEGDHMPPDDFDRIPASTPEAAADLGAVMLDGVEPEIPANIREITTAYRASHPEGRVNSAEDATRRYVENRETVLGK